MLIASRGGCSRNWSSASVGVMVDGLLGKHRLVRVPLLFFEDGLVGLVVLVLVDFLLVLVLGHGRAPPAS